MFCKAKLLRNTIAETAPDQLNVVLKNSAIAVSLKFLNNFHRSLEMLLKNCKI